ncbi:MAG: ThuA domain-containing protein [Verrucomicrobia bacterium]|nr:ThuA domain-containing protein [Verrucomicrobiota bacterium]
MKQQIRFWLPGLAAFVLLLCWMATSAHADTNQIRVLIVTGQDWPGHLWRETAPALRQLLEQDKRFAVRIVEDPHALDSATLTNYHVALLHFQNWQQPGPGVAARENLRRFVENGGGLMSVHFACGAWQGEWPDFANIIGRVWDPKLRGHDPRGKFTVQIVDREHAVTRGLKDFETDDELYTCLVGDAPIHLLAQAKSKVDHRDYPMAFTRDYGKGRVFLTTLGHDVKAFTNSCVPQLVRQGCAWAAGKPPPPSR